MKIEKVITGDGTATLKRVDLDETYHSVHGAMQESMHVFIKNGLHTVPGPTVKLLEVGLGTGLNALLTAVYAENRNIDYTALDPFPLKHNQVADLGFDTVNEHAAVLLKNILDTPHYQKVKLNNNMVFEFIQEKLQHVRLMHKFDLIYYDAFGPRAQPEMWETPVIDILTGHAKPGTVMVTYCAQGQFRRNMELAGWKVEKLEGPPGKREMVRAVKE